jgi:hypothetical protein
LNPSARSIKAGTIQHNAAHRERSYLFKMRQSSASSLKLITQKRFSKLHPIPCSKMNASMCLTIGTSSSQQDDGQDQDSRLPNANFHPDNCCLERAVFMLGFHLICLICRLSLAHMRRHCPLFSSVYGTRATSIFIYISPMWCSLTYDY